MRTLPLHRVELSTGYVLGHLASVPRVGEVVATPDNAYYRISDVLWYFGTEPYVYLEVELVSNA